MSEFFSATGSLGKSCQVEFITSVFKNSQLPSPDYPEIAFAGRSNAWEARAPNGLTEQK